MSTNKSDVKVIGAGWGRTGTASLKSALEILGVGPCYHMKEVFGKGDADKWSEFVDNPTDLSLLHSMLGGNGFGSTCDVPSSMFWKEQMELYPNAKVVLTARDPEKWYKSACDTIFQMQPGRPGQALGIRISMAMGLPTPGVSRMMDKLITQKFLHGDWSKANVLQAYKSHCDDVLRHCPPEKLLVFEVSQGWAPLCAFLDLPIPDVPFPHVNDTKEFQQIIHRVNMTGYGILLGGVVVVGAVVSKLAVGSFFPFLK